MSSVSIDVDPDTFLVFRSDFCSATSVRIFVRNVSNDKAAIFKVKLLLNLFARYMVYKIFILCMQKGYRIYPIFIQIKATCPHRYVVKPHRGEIPASSNMEIDVTLLPFNFKETEKYNDKFLLQVRCILQNIVLDLLIIPQL